MHWYYVYAACTATAMFVRLHRSCTIRGYIDISCRESDLLDVQEVLAALVSMLDDVLANGSAVGRLNTLRSDARDRRRDKLDLENFVRWQGKAEQVQ